MFKISASICVLAGVLSAQELRLGPVTASRGKPTPVRIALAASPKTPITALQWELVFPEAQLHIQDGDWAASKEAVASGKSLSCVRQLRRQPDGFAYRCILAGGSKPLPNGSIAVLKVVAVGPPGAGSAVLRLENAVAATTSGKPVPIRSIEASIAVR